MFFLGEKTQAKFYNEKLYREGTGLFPAPVVRETQLLVDRLAKGADIEPADEGIFKIFSGERNSYLAGVTIDRYISVPRGWKPAADSDTRVLARLRNGDPLAAEHKFGKGHVVALFSTAAPVWNNWGRNPSFVVAMLEAQAYLAGSRTSTSSQTVGAPLAIDLDPARYQSQVKFLAPAAGETTSITVDAAPTARGLTAALAQTETAGVYEARLTTTENQDETRRFAYNVEADEGDLTLVDRDRLAARLPGLRYEYRNAGDFQVTARELAGSNLSEWLLYSLIAILVGEQLLAYAISYHPRTREARGELSAAITICRRRHANHFRVGADRIGVRLAVANRRDCRAHRVCDLHVPEGQRRAEPAGGSVAHGVANWRVPDSGSRLPCNRNGVMSAKKSPTRARS